MLCNALLLILVVGFKAFRFKHRNNTRFHEYVVIAIVAIPTLLCSLTNTNHLPNDLLGQGLDEFRSDYTGKFFFLFLFSLVNIDKVVVYIGPLYLIAQYFYLSWQMGF